MNLETYAGLLSQNNSKTNDPIKGMYTDIDYKSYSNKDPTTPTKAYANTY